MQGDRTVAAPLRNFFVSQQSRQRAPWIPQINRGLTFSEFHNSKVFFVILLTAIFAFIFQSSLVFNGDAAYLAFAARQLLAHGAYGRDIFETNPPMILYLMLPVIGLQKLLPLSLVTMYRWYVLALAILSSTVSFLLLKVFIKKEDVFLKNAVLTAILFVLFFLPMSSFAQREHFFIILTFPYVFLSVLRLQGKSIPVFAATLIGFFAGLGFSLKPFFLVTLALIELYGMYQKKNFFYWLRAESITIFTVIFLYLCLIVIDEPGYIQYIFPWVLKYYFPFYKIPWEHMALYPFIQFILIILISYFIFPRSKEYPHFTRILWLATVGMCMAFIIPRMPWYYHILPALGFAIILGAVYIGEFFKFFKATYKIFFMVLSFFLLFGSCYFEIIKSLPKLLNEQDYHEQQMIASALKAKPGKQSMICLLTETRPCFPLVYHLQGEFVGRFPLLWWFNGIQATEGKMHEKDEAAFIHVAVQDLNQRQARWLITNPQILTYLLKNAEFTDAFQHYTYYITINHREIYERIS
jgi:hypothetical protein